jgi:uncharacterized protein (TIGR03086 family)
MNDLVAGIHAALDATRPIIAAVPERMWDAPTPCVEWTVHQVTNHLVGGLCIYTGELTGHPTEQAHDSDWLGTAPLAAYLAAATADAHAWSLPEALAGVITIGLGTLPAPLAAVIHLTEILVHGVDVAVAINREDLIDQDQCASLLLTMEEMGGVDAYRQPGIFGPATAVSDDAVPHQQLLGFLGRANTTATSLDAGTA